MIPGTTYPDITTLPALARVLKTDLNTLLSFQEDLTDEEIARFVGELKDMVEAQGYDAAFQKAMEQIHQYPNCEKLIYSLVFYLDGARAIYDVPDPDDYTDRLMPFYEGLSRSETPAVRDAALSMCCQHGLPFRGVSARMWSGMAKAKAAERCGCFAGTCCGRFLNDVYGWRNVGCQYF